MFDHSEGKVWRTEGGSPSAKSNAAERRGTNRHAITAVAEIVDVASGARFATRTSDLGPGGCFVDSLTPFPIGSKVRVSVRESDTEFEVGGTIVYSQVGLGMGIAFDALTFEQRMDLEGWLVQITSGKRGSGERQASPKVPQLQDDTSRNSMVQLIQLLVSKRILTDSEAASILHKPLL